MIKTYRWNILKKSPSLAMVVRRPATKRSTPAASAASLCGLPKSKPEAEALASAPLEQLKEVVAAEVKCGALAGAAHVVLRHGKCVMAFGDGKASKDGNFTLRTGIKHQLVVESV